jgi:hypothetical protein
LVVAAAGEGEVFFGTPRFGGVVNELRAVITVRLFYGGRGRIFSGPIRLRKSIIEERVEGEPA